MSTTRLVFQQQTLDPEMNRELQKDSSCYRKGASSVWSLPDDQEQ